MIKQARNSALFLLLLIATKSFSAENCVLEQPGSEKQLIQFALRCNPGQHSMSTRWRAKQHRIKAAGELDDPNLRMALAPETFKSGGADDGVVVELSQTLPWPGVLALRKKAAVLAANMWSEQFSQTQILLAKSVRIAIAHGLYHHKLLEINTQHQQLMQNIIEIVENNYTTGIANKSAVLQAIHRAHTLRKEAITLKATLRRDTYRLQRLLNIPDKLTLTEMVIEQPILVEVNRAVLDRLLEGVEQQPEVQAVAFQLQQKSVELDLAKKNHYPDITVMTRYNTLWDAKDKWWLIGASINVPFDFGKRIGIENSLSAEKMSLHWQQKDKIIQLREQLLIAYSGWQEAQEANTLYQHHLLPLAEESLSTAHEEYQSGAGNFITLLETQQQYLTTARDAVQAIRDQALMLSQLTAAAGLVFRDTWTCLEVEHE